MAPYAQGPRVHRGPIVRQPGPIFLASTQNVNDAARPMGFRFGSRYGIMGELGMYPEDVKW